MKPWNPNIRVQRESFDLAEESRRLTEGRTDVGAVVAFTGYCRDEGETLAALELEHYPGMAEEEISRIAREAAERWPLLGLTVIHRIGRIEPGEPIVLVLDGLGAPPGRLRGGVVPDGLSENPRALLEEGAPRRRQRSATGSRRRRRTTKRRRSGMDRDKTATATPLFRSAERSTRLATGPQLGRAQPPGGVFSAQAGEAPFRCKAGRAPRRARRKRQDSRRCLSCDNMQVQEI